jgi:anaphase-promoting complex subunit 8
MYLFGVVLKKLGLASMSLKVLVESLHKEPCNWAAWQELIEHIDERQTLQELDLPEHWLKHLFSAHIFQVILLFPPYFSLHRVMASKF